MTKTQLLDGKPITFSPETLFTIQTGTNTKRYKTKCEFKGNLGRAVSIYNCYSVHSGGKKRILIDGKLLTRVITT